MPMAIGFRTVAVLSPRTDNTAVFYSRSFDEEVSFEIASMRLRPDGRWSDYPAGVLWSLLQEGFKIGGFDMSLVGDVPLGAGLSSSASLEVAAAMALLEHAKKSRALLAPTSGHLIRSRLLNHRLTTGTELPTRQPCPLRG